MNLMKNLAMFSAAALAAAAVAQEPAPEQNGKRPFGEGRPQEMRQRQQGPEMRGRAPRMNGPMMMNGGFRLETLEAEYPAQIAEIRKLIFQKAALDSKLMELQGVIHKAEAARMEQLRKLNDEYNASKDSKKLEELKAILAKRHAKVTAFAADKVKAAAADLAALQKSGVSVEALNKMTHIIEAESARYSKAAEVTLADYTAREIAKLNMPRMRGPEGRMCPGAEGKGMRPGKDGKDMRPGRPGKEGKGNFRKPGEGQNRGEAPRRDAGRPENGPEQDD